MSIYIKHMDQLLGELSLLCAWVEQDKSVELATILHVGERSGIDAWLYINEIFSDMEVYTSDQPLAVYCRLD